MASQLTERSKLLSSKFKDEPHFNFNLVELFPILEIVSTSLTDPGLFHPSRFSNFFSPRSIVPRTLK